MQATIIAIVVVYLGIMLFIGYLMSKRIKSNDDFALAGRNLGPWLIAGTLAATNIGGGSSLGITEKAYGDWGVFSHLVRYYRRYRLHRSGLDSA